jgi:hypothetical protein
MLVLAVTLLASVGTKYLKKVNFGDLRGGTNGENEAKRKYYESI